MAVEQRGNDGIEPEPTVEATGYGPAGAPETPSRKRDLGDLLRRLGDDSKELVRQELNLAKLEMKQMANELARDLVGVGIALAVAAVGGLALTAFLILVIGELLDAFWAGALIVGGVFLLIGAVMAKSAISDLQHMEKKPDQTMETLREDKKWARNEAREMKRGLTS